MITNIPLVLTFQLLQDGSNLPASQRAYHPEEVPKRNHLHIDTKYYLAHQVHPVVSRLCDPIEGTDAAHIADCLGKKEFKCSLGKYYLPKTASFYYHQNRLWVQVPAGPVYCIQ